MKYLALLLALSFGAHSNVYKCEVNGTITYSQVPCGDDAEVTDYTIKTDAAEPAQLEPQAQPVAGISAAAIGESPKQTFDRIALINTKRDLMSRINWRKSEVKRVIAERNAKIAAIRNKKGKVQLNIAGVLYEDSLSNDVLAVTSQYDVTINELNREIDQMQSDYDKL